MSTLTYIKGNILRKILNRSSCQICMDTLISNIKDENVSAFILQMDFSGNSLLEPTESMMIFFQLLLSVYVHFKPSIYPLSSKMNILKTLCLAGLQYLTYNNFVLTFCKDHNQTFSQIMIQATMKTFLKAFVHEMNEKLQRRSVSELKVNSRKINILTKSKA